MTKISTLQEKLNGDYSLTAYCSCGHGRKLDIAALIARLGPDFEIVRNREWLLSRLKCEVCGGTAVTIHSTWNGVPKSW